MSIKFVDQFHRKIYEILSGNKNIRSQVQSIYLSVNQDGKYPSILIDITKVNSLGRNEDFIYEIEFEICIFARERNKGALLSIANEISGCLTPENCGFQQYLVAGLKVKSIEFEKAEGMVLDKLTMNYQSLIKKISAYEFS